MQCFLHVFKPFSLTVVEKLDYFMVVTSARSLSRYRGSMKQPLYPLISCCVVACVEYHFKVLRDPLSSRRWVLGHRVLTTSWMSTMSYPQFSAVPTWATRNVEWVPLWVLVIFSVNKADVVYNSKYRVKEYFVIDNYFTISRCKIKSFQVKIFALLYVHPELDLLWGGRHLKVVFFF